MADKNWNVKIGGDESTSSGVTTLGAVTNIKLEQGTVILNKSDTFRSNATESTTPISANPDRVLNQLQDSLRILFKTQDAWFVPFHWMTSNRYEAEDYFVRLDLEELNRNGTQIKTANVQYEDLFLPSSNSSSPNATLSKPKLEEPRRILLQGEAGFGKSTLCVKMANEWSVNSNSVLQKFQLVILLRLRSVSTTLDQSVVEFCSKTIGSKVDENLLVDIIINLGSEVLLILDGLDEVAEDRLLEIRDVLSFDQAQPSFLRNCTFLFTSRPGAIDTSFNLVIDRNARIRSLKTPDAFLSTYFKSERSVNELKEKLDRIQFSSQWSPLLLYIVCYLYENGELGYFQREDQLLKAILKLLATRCMYREGMSYYEHEQWNLFLKLGELFLECLLINKYYVHEDDIETTFGEDSLFVKKCGVLKLPPPFERQNREVQSYEPIHKIFVEFLAIAYLNSKCTQLNFDEKKDFVSSLLLKCYRPEYTVRLFDIGSQAISTTLISPVIGRSISVKIETFKQTDGEDSKVKFMNHKKYSETLKLLDSSTKSVNTDTLVYVKQTGQISYLPPQFRATLRYFLSSYKYEKFADLCSRYKKFEPFRVKVLLKVQRDCLCSLDHTKLPLDLANFKSKFFPSISNFNFNQSEITCAQCGTYYQPVADMLVRSCSIAATLIATCPMRYLIESPDLFQSVINNDCSFCGIFPGLSKNDEGSGIFGLQSVLSLFLKHALKCTEYEIHIGSFTELASFVRLFIRSISTTRLEVPITVSVNKGNAKCTMIPNKTTNTMEFFCHNGQPREPMLQSSNSNAVTRFMSLLGPNMLKNGLFKVSLSVTALSTFLLIDWIDNYDERATSETTKVRFQILRNKSLNPDKAVRELQKMTSMPGVFDIL